jgi:hypothetical protein
MKRSCISCSQLCAIALNLALVKDSSGFTPLHHNSISRNSSHNAASQVVENQAESDVRESTESFEVIASLAATTLYQR